MLQAACVAVAVGGCDVASHGAFGDGTTLASDVPSRAPTADASVVVSPVPPFPLSGGTLLVASTGDVAVVSDPDRDRIVVVDLAAGKVRSLVATEGRAQPGRAVDDGERAYVVLRRTGRIATLDLATGALVSSIPVCDAPRGVAFDPGAGLLRVACEGGELMTLVPGDTPVVMRTTRLAPDLRDVVVASGHVFVSHFRSAELSVLDAADDVASQPSLASYVATSGHAYSAAVAWRMVETSDHHVVVVHQRERDDDVPLGQPPSAPASPVPGQAAGPYGSSDCRLSVVHSAVGVFDASGKRLTKSGAGGLANMALSVDVAASRTGGRVAVLSASTGGILEGPASELTSFDGCASGQPRLDTSSVGDTSLRKLSASHEPIAVAYNAVNQVVVQTREPATLQIFGRDTDELLATIPLGGDSRRDDAHATFHGIGGESGTLAITCASCHPEGRDDGHVFRLGGAKRRTQSLAAFSLETAPFHWEGDLASVPALVDQVLVGRMGGVSQSAARSAALASWMTNIPPAARASVGDASSVARGKILFESADVGCTACHDGPRFTNDLTLDVGTGGAFQVPSLVGVSARAPFMHDGCARTLAGRFSNACGGGDRHGHTSQLEDAQVDDLVAYLTSL